MSDGHRIGHVRIMLSQSRSRRVIYLIAVLLLALLSVFPAPFIARAKLLPQDSSSAGLGQIVSSLGGQFSTFATLLSGGRPPNDLYLIIGRSNPVAEEVITSLKLAGPGREFATDDAARVYLDEKVDVHLLIGGVLEVETITHDADKSLALTRAFLAAMSDRIGALGRQTTRRKSEIVNQRFHDAAARVKATEIALDAFRQQNKLANFEGQLTAQLTLRTDLQASLQAKMVELSILQQTAGPESAQLRATEAEVATLRRQIGDTGESSQSSAGPNVTGLSVLSSRYLDLYRDYKFAQALYDVYARAAEQTAVEDLVSESATYIQIVEPAHLEAGRHYNVPALALLAAVLFLAFFTEIYAPMTGLDWPGLLGNPQEHD